MASGSNIGSRPLSVYLPRIERGTREVDGTIENSHGEFSLENPRFDHGKPVIFDADGREK